MEHVTNLIHQAVSTILFCIAVTLFLYQMNVYLSFTRVLKEKYTEGEELYESLCDTEVENVVTSADLIAIFLSDLEYDVEINGYLISRYEHTIDQLEKYPIVEGATYRKSYSYDRKGNVTRIIYHYVHE